MKFCLTLPLILSAGLQIFTTFAQNEEEKSLRRGLAYGVANGKGLQRIVASNNDCLLIRTSIDHVVTAPCTPEQRLRKNWTFKSKTKQIINEKNGKCLDLSTTDKNKVITYECNSSNSQEWKYDSYEDRIVNRSNDKCMKLIDSDNIRVANCDGSKKFQFTLESDEPLISKPSYGQLMVDKECVEMSLSNDNNVSVQPCKNRDQQQWFYDPNEETFKNKFNGYCLDFRKSDRNVVGWPCNNKINQRWKVIDNYTANWGKIKSRESRPLQDHNKCLNVSTVKNINVRQCENRVSQNFMFSFNGSHNDPPTKSPTSSGSSTSLALIKTSNTRCLETSYNNVFLGFCDDGENQKWSIDQFTKEIKTVDNKCLQIKNTGYYVFTALCNGKKNQKWKFTSGSIENVDGKCLSFDSNSNIHTVDCNYGPNQYFFRAPINVMYTPSPTPSPVGNSYSIKNEGRCLQVIPNQKSVSMQYCDGGESQKWVHTNGLVKNTYYNKCLDVDQSSDMGDIIVWDCHGRSNQKWELPYGKMKSLYNGQCATTESNKSLRLYNCNGDQNQQFYHSNTQPPPTDKYKPIADSMSQCVDMSSSGQVFSAYCTESQKQRWYFNKEAQTIKNESNGWCLDVDQQNYYTIIAWSECHGRTNQQWLLDGNEMKSLYNAECMTRESNMSFKLRPCNGNQNQKFYHGNIQPPPPEKYKPITDSMSQCVEMPSSGQVFSAYCTNSKNQQWYINTLTNTIKNEWNGWCLDVDQQNSNIIIWEECHGRNNQQWILDGSQMKSLYNNECMTRQSNMTFKLLPCNGDQTQQFYYNGNTQPPAQYKPIKKSNEQCVDMTVKGGNVFIASCNWSKTQNWYINTQTKTIKNDSNGWCLDVDQQSTGNIIAWKECHGRTNQQWILDAGNALKSMLEDKGVMTVNENNNIFLSEYVGSDSQSFSY